MGKLTYGILAYGNQNLVTKCLQTFRLFHPDDPIIVGDNGGPDGELTKQICQMFNATYIINPTNDSLSKLMNMIIDKAETEYVCLVTQGVEFTTRLTEQFESDFERDPLVAVIGGLLMYPDGRIQHGGGRRFWNYGAMGHYGQGQYPHQAKLCSIPAYRLYVTGATAAIRKSFWQGNKYDETITMSCEDTDICFKAWQSGNRVLYDPLITSIHKEGASRGATMEEKVNKAPWLLQREHNSLEIFKARYSDENVYKIDLEVNRLNKELHPDLPKAFIRNGATGDVLRTLQVYDSLPAKDKIVIITQSPEVFRDRECYAITGNNEEYAVSHFIDLDLAYERDRTKPIERSYGEVATGSSFFKNKPIELKSTAFDWLAVRQLKPNFKWDKPFIVMHMYNGWAGKTIQPDFWRYLAIKLTEKGYGIVAVGGGGDLPPEGNNIISVVGQTSLHGLRELCKRAKLFIGMDTGPLHIADGVCPAIGLFTITRPELLVSDKVTGIMTKAECGGCIVRRTLTTQYACDFGELDMKRFQCVNGFDPNEIITKALELMEAK